MKTPLYLEATLLLICLPLAAETLTITQAIEKALVRNRQLQAGRLKQAEMAEGVGAAKSRRWPVFSTNVQLGPTLNRATVQFPKGAFGDYASTGPIPEQDTSVTLPRRFSGFAYTTVGMPLTQQWKIGAAIDAARLRQDEASLETERSEQEVTAQVRRGYFTLAATEAATRAAEKNLELALEIERLAREGVDKGVALPSDHQEALARTARASAAVEQLRIDRHDLREQLNQVMGQPLDYDWEATPALIPEPEALAQAELFSRAASRPEVRMAGLRVRQQEVAARAKKAEYIPDVSLGITHFGFLNTGSFAPSNFAFAGVQMQWDIWDWGRKSHELKAIRYQAEQAKLAADETREQVTREAAAAWREWEQSQRNWVAAQASVEATEESLRVARARFEQQAALLRRVLEAQADYATALEQEARAFAGRGLAWTNLQLALGAKP